MVRSRKNQFSVICVFTVFATFANIQTISAATSCKIWYFDCDGRWAGSANSSKWVWYTSTSYGNKKIPCQKAQSLAASLQTSFQAQGYNVSFRSANWGDTPSPSPCGSSIPSPTQPTLLWQATHEMGNLAEWEIWNSGKAQAVASRDFAHSGRWSAKGTITAPPVSGVRLARRTEPADNPEAYYSAWIYIPKVYRHNKEWYSWNLMQFKSQITRNGSMTSDPFWIVGVDNRANGTMYLDLVDWQQSVQYTQSSVNLPVAKWFHLEVFYKQSDSEDGRITVWQDGVQLYDAQNIRTKYPPSAGDGKAQWSVNIYSAGVSPAPSTIYVDDAAISLVKLGK